MSEANIIITPHALTWWNIKGKRQGHIDTPLSDIGHDMAALLAQRLSTQPLQAVYSSDLRRAIDTAAPVASSKGLDISTDNRLREGRWGDTDDPEGHPVLSWHSQSETREEVVGRMAEAMHEIAERHIGESALVVSHGAAIAWFVRHVLGLHPEDKEVYRTTRAGINLFHYKSGSWKASILNDNSHLSALNHPALNANSG
ncbi:MAG: histidine phosphatase family protein [Calditrichia bacterium]